jgi:hypothetical protein
VDDCGIVAILTQYMTVNFTLCLARDLCSFLLNVACDTALTTRYPDFSLVALNGGAIGALVT